ncbi:hypothetical protein BGZ60DRAFT_421170 [Tricladium varicosporioides]|nr:hypothetical protein BGZ60DRAFT_421170 [Hymenoscyphus varicosporioides]
MALEKTIFDTLLRSSSAFQKGIEQTHNEVDQRIREPASWCDFCSRSPNFTK